VHLPASVITAQAIRIIADATSNEIPIQQAMIVLALLDSSGPLPMQDLQSFARVSQASISRNCMVLSDWIRAGVPGYGLIESYDDPEYRRRKLVRLTPKGEVLRRKIKELA
jgi:DNA-binding MarR family transcriptional regulator